MVPTRPASVPNDARYNVRDARWEASKLEGGVPIGPMRAFRPDGTLLFEARFVDGRLQGPFRRFHPDGTIAREGTYEAGKPRGTFVVTRGADEAPVEFADPRAKRVVVQLDGRGEEQSRYELDELGREVRPGVALDPRAGSVDALFEHGPDGFLASGAFAKILRVLAPPPAPPPRMDALHLPVSFVPKRRMTPQRFEELYGFAMPSELSAWLDAVAGSPSLRALRASADLDFVASGNLVEAAVVEHQSAPGRTTFFKGLLSACLPLAETAPKQRLFLALSEASNGLSNAVYPVDLGDGMMGTPVARSLDDLAYLVALATADQAGALSRGALGPTYERLRGRVDLEVGVEARALPGGGGDEVVGDTEGDHRQGFAFRRAVPAPRLHLYRARWIAALLRGHAEEAYALFLPPWDAALDKQDEAHVATLREGVRTRVSTSLYALFRAWVFDLPELPHLLEIARSSPSLLIRDGARLVAELAAGRRALGSVEDLVAVRDAFVALKPKEKKDDEDEDEEEEDDEDEDDDG